MEGQTSQNKATARPPQGAGRKLGAWRFTEPAGGWAGSHAEGDRWRAGGQPWHLGAMQAVHAGDSPRLRKHSAPSAEPWFRQRREEMNWASSALPAPQDQWEPRHCVQHSLRRLEADAVGPLGLLPVSLPQVGSSNGHRQKAQPALSLARDR